MIEAIVILAITGLGTMHWHNYKKKRVYDNKILSRMENTLDLLGFQHRALVSALAKESKNGFQEYYQDELERLISERKIINGE